MPPSPRRTSHSKHGCRRRSYPQPHTTLARKPRNAALWRSIPPASKRQSLASDIFDKLRVGVRLRVIPFIFPNRQRLDVYLRFRQQLKSNIRHLDRSLDQLATLTLQNDGDVHVAVGAMSAAGTAAEQNRGSHQIAGRGASNEFARGTDGVEVRL